jgi:hypothetical protein
MSKRSLPIPMRPIELLGAALLVAALVLVSSCSWVTSSSGAVQGAYVAVGAPSLADGKWVSATIVLRDGAGTLVTPAETHELTFTLSSQSSPWITVVLDDGTAMQLQYRRPGQLTLYDAVSGPVDFRRIGR